MTKVTTLGITSIRLGPVANDGGAGADNTLVVIGDTYEDTAEMVQDDPTKTQFFAEEYDTAFYTSVQNGKIVFNFGLAMADVDQIQAVFGGTVAAGPPKSWGMPSAFVTIEQTVKITPRVGLTFLIPRGLVTAKMGGKFSKKSPFIVSVSVEVLQPNKANTPPMTVTNPA